MTLIQYVHIGILVLLLGAQLRWRSFLVLHARKMFWLMIALTALVLLYESQQQFVTWATATPPARYLVPPYQSLGYFLFYIFYRIWAPYIVSGLMAAIVLIATIYGNKRFGQRFFYSEEPYLIALSFFIIGHPLWIGYLFLTIVAYCIYMLIRHFYARRPGRVTFYYFWLPIAIAILALLPLLRTTKLFLLLKL